jgi:hypothetical protein
MANAYTAVPSIIPGPLTVQGLLTVGSDQGIKIGGSAPFVRLFKRGGAGLGLTYNLATDEGSKDTGAVVHALFSDPARTDFFLRFAPPVAGLFTAVLDTTIAQDGTAVVQTGDTILHTMKSKLILANTLGAHGGFIVESEWTSTVQGGVASTIAVAFGGFTLTCALPTTTNSLMVRARFLAKNATNNLQVDVLSISAAGVITQATLNFTPDTTLDQTLSLTFQGGAAADTWTLQWWKVHALVGRAAAL